MTGVTFKISKNTLQFINEKITNNLYSYFNFENEYMIEAIGLGHKCFVASNSSKYPYMPSKKGMKKVIEDFNQMESEDFFKCFYFVVPMTHEEMKTLDYDKKVKSL